MSYFERKRNEDGSSEYLPLEKRQKGTKIMEETILSSLDGRVQWVGVYERDKAGLIAWIFRFYLQVIFKLLLFVCFYCRHFVLQFIVNAFLTCLIRDRPFYHKVWVVDTLTKQTKEKDGVNALRVSDGTVLTVNGVNGFNRYTRLYWIDDGVLPRQRNVSLKNGRNDSRHRPNILYRLT